MKRKLIFVIVAQLWVCSCATLPETIPSSDTIHLSTTNSNLINGTYSIYSIDSSSYDLDILLINKRVHGHYLKLDSNASVELEYINNKRLYISVFNADTLLIRKKITGKLKDGNLVLRSQSHLAFFTFIFNGLSSRKSRLSLLNNNRIKIDSGNNELLLCLIFPLFGGSGQVSGLEFEKIE